MSAAVMLHDMNMEEIVASFIEIDVPSSDDFLKIKETLTRIGIANRTKKILYQSCHILHKKGKYYIVHFKELFGLDGRVVEFSKEDIDRRNLIALTLESWNLCSIIKNKPVKSEEPTPYNVTVLSHSVKNDWQLKTKYKMAVPVNTIR